jgi:6-phosphogluconolactonase/glucosamine-6-phosphate isomerase/deaminase
VRVRRSCPGALDLKEARIFNLDEYCGLPPADCSSFAATLHRHLIEPLGLGAGRVRRPLSTEALPIPRGP